MLSPNFGRKHASECDGPALNTSTIWPTVGSDHYILERLITLSVKIFFYLLKNPKTPVLRFQLLAPNPIPQKSTHELRTEPTPKLQIYQQKPKTKSTANIQRRQQKRILDSLQRPNHQIPPLLRQHTFNPPHLSRTRIANPPNIPKIR